MKSRICPQCISEMDKISHPDITIDRCSKCGGTFLDKGELNVLSTGMAGDIEHFSTRKEVLSDDHPSRSCPNPSCAEKTMKKVNILGCTGVILDYCDNCEGFFADKDEIQLLNEEELVFLTKGKSAEEFREYINGHLVRSDRISDVIEIATGIHGATVPQNVNYIQISVYFKTPLKLDLRIYSEKLMHKFLKVIGFFRKQDIKTGNEKVDSLFIIQGNNEENVKSLLSKLDVQDQLIEFQQRKFRILKKRGAFEITDKRIVYTEGPYTGDVKYDVAEDRVGVVGGMLGLVRVFET